MIFPVLFIFVIYSILILSLSKGFDQLKSPEPKKNPPANQFSILVPFRNEARNLPDLLNSFMKLDYPMDKIEFILINDESDDESERIIKDFKGLHRTLNLVMIRNQSKSDSPKKDALELGVNRASNPWIITTDADCIVPKTWLMALNNFICSDSPKMIVAPVTYFDGKGFLDKFQLLDFLSLQGTTMGSFGLKGKGVSRPFLCNGANLCYEKKAFLDVDGYEGNRDIVSGDDVFLLEKMYNRYPEKVKFLKSEEAVVQTATKGTLRELIHQRIRWAAKTSSYGHAYGKMVGSIVFLANTLIIILLILSLFNSFPWVYFGFFFLLKFNLDFILLYKTSSFFNQTHVLRAYFLSSLAYPFFAVFVALLSFRKSFKWKERTFQK
jgi:cellulose synthase/poly-beta-1,6-N-acetylglucosamine synthase-like glycosyltransferase